LQRLYETILCRSLDKRNFRKKILATGLLIPLDEVETGVAHRAAQLFSFDKVAYAALNVTGINLEF
jgi:8-oxo-dGTP diphosphatase